jgi:hypothetical protein
MDRSSSTNITKSLNKLRVTAGLHFRLKAREIYYQVSAFQPVSLFKIREVARLAEGSAIKFVQDSVTQVVARCGEPFAYAMIYEALAMHVSDMEGAAEEGFGTPLSASTVAAAAERFEIVRDVAIQCLKNHRQKFGEVKNPGGVDPIWDWEGAKAHIKKLFPDGIPKVRGMNSKIATMFANWFLATAGEEPSPSMRKEHARQLMDEFQKVTKGR